MKNKLLSFFLALSILASVTACGSGNTEVTTPAETSSAPSETTTSEAVTSETEATTTEKAAEGISDVAVSYKELWEAGEEVPPLYKMHEDYFKTGVALGSWQIKNAAFAETVKAQFNSITAENEMKPDAILDPINCSHPEELNLEPAIKSDNMDVILKFAQENNMQVRLHTLVWHSQTPNWFFKENYSKSADAVNVSREVMLARMESYIKQVLEYCDTNYPGIVYAVDVVNEAIEPGDSRKDGIRVTNNLWFEVVGEDYVEMAFTYARKYAPSYMKLFYNDYGCHSNMKRMHITNLLTPLIERGLVDGIGLQSHYSMGDPTTIDLQSTIEKYAALGLEIQVTELDINTTDGSEEGLVTLGIRYKKLINTYKYLMDKGIANITSVTVWGLTDGQSWLNKPGEPRYGLLFDDDYNPKDAYWGFYQDSSIKNF